MKSYFSALTLLFCLFALGYTVCQTEAPKICRPFLRSWQGQPEKPDRIDHKPASKGANLVCYQVESYPKQGDDGRACLLTFQDGSKSKLNFKESLRVAKDDEISLQCLGDKPTLCSVGIWFDPPTERSQ